MAGKTFNLAGMDSAHLGKMTARRTAKKLSLKGKKPWKKKGWGVALQGHLGMESQQVAFRKIRIKEENYKI